jgi:hypothetical protein
MDPNDDFNIIRNALNALGHLPAIKALSRVEARRNMKTFTVTNEQFCTLMSAIQHAIDVYQDTHQPKTEADAAFLRSELNRQANEQTCTHALARSDVRKIGG